MTQVTRFFSIAGSNFRSGATDAITRFRNEQVLSLLREPGNKYDKNAVLVCYIGGDGLKRPVGYLPSGLAAEVAPVIDSGASVICRYVFRTVEQINGQKNAPPGGKQIGVGELAYVKEEATT